MADTGTLETTQPDVNAQVPEPYVQQSAPASTMGAPDPAQGGAQQGPPALITDASSIGGGPLTRIDNGDAPTASNTADMQHQVRGPSLGQHILYGVLDALGGTTQTQYQLDPATGKMQATQVAQGPGMQFKRIIAGAMQGLAASAGAGVGPGHLGRSLGAGIGGGIQAAQQQDQQKYDRANQDFNTQQKAKLSNAQLTSLNISNVAGSLQNARLGAQATEGEVEGYNQWNNLLRDAPGAKRFGTFHSMDELMAATEKDPQLHAAVGNGLVVHTVYDADHKVMGFEAAQVPQAWLERKIDKPQKFPTYEPPDPQHPEQGPKLKWNTADAGTMSNGDILKYYGAANAEGMKYYTEERNRQSAEKIAAGNNRAQLQGDSIKAGAEVEAAKVRSGAVGGLPQDDAGNVDMSKVSPADKQIMQAVANGGDLSRLIGRRATEAQMKYYTQGAMTLDPTMVNSPSGSRQKAYQELTASNGKGYQQIYSVNTGLVHFDDLSQAIQGLRNTSPALINKPFNVLVKQMSTNPALAAVMPPLIAARNQAQLFLNGNNALKKEDVEEGAKALNEDMPLSQMQASIKGFGKIMADQANEIHEGEKAVFGGRAPVPVLHPRSVRALRNFGLNGYDHLAGDPQQQGAAAPQQHGQAQQGQLPPGVQPGEKTAIGPGNHVIVVRGGRWVDPVTNQAVQ